MRVTVLLFARLRELAGRSTWECDAPAGATVADIWRMVAAAHPAVADFAPAVSAAINADFSPMRATVRDGDEVAFLPPVSGGTTET